METNTTIYELVTPSDPITFRASDDKIAFTCAVLLGRGKAGCTNLKTGENIPSMLLFVDNHEEVAADYVGMELCDFISANRESISTCFDSFAYGSLTERQIYDDAIEAITDAGKLKAFKAKHEEQNRTSMSKWVKAAWSYAEDFKTITTND